MKSLHDEVAEYLDRTLEYDGRGPFTFHARRRLSEFLDSGKKYKSIRRDLRHLAYVVTKEKENLIRDRIEEDGIMGDQNG